jgi:hypothetical protein
MGRATRRFSRIKPTVGGAGGAKRAEGGGEKTEGGRTGGATVRILRNKPTMAGKTEGGGMILLQGRNQKWIHGA